MGNFKLSPALVAIAVGFLAFIIGAYVFLTAIDKDTAGIQTLLLGSIFPFLTSLFIGARQDQQKKATEAVAEKLEQVEANTNGTTTAHLNLISRQSDQLAAAATTPPVVNIAVPPPVAGGLVDQDDDDEGGRHEAPVPV